MRTAAPRVLATLVMALFPGYGPEVQSAQAKGPGEVAIDPQPRIAYA
jgi:hypothetical protein